MIGENTRLPRRPSREDLLAMINGGLSIPLRGETKIVNITQVMLMAGD
jgi:hypothetical protein